LNLYLAGWRSWAFWKTDFSPRGNLLVESRSRKIKGENYTEERYLISNVPVRIKSASRTTLKRIHYLFEHFNQNPEPSEPWIDYRIDFKPSNRKPLILWKEVENRPLFRTDDESEMAAFLEKSIAYSVLAVLNDHLLVHAGAVQYRGEGMILPARSGRGKSLMVLGLVVAGHKLLSDDTALIKAEQRTVYPHATSLCFKEDSKPLLRNYKFRPARRRSFVYKGKVIYYLNPLDISRDCIGAPCNVKYIIFPDYEPGCKTTLEEISRGETTFRLVQNSFNFGARGKDSLDHLVDLVEKACCYELRLSDLKEGVRAIQDLN